MPTEIASRQLWSECLEELIAVHPWPPTVRFLVADWLPQTLLQDWSVKHARYVTTVTPKLDMPGLPLELLAHLPGTGPGFEFRRLFVQLCTAASTGQVAQIPRLAHSALRIAEAQGWFALGSAVHLLLGGGLAASGQTREVLEAYRSARQMARKVTDPSGPKMAVTAALAEGGALLEAGDYRAARNVYLEAAREADEGAQTMSSMDAHRMASYCAEADGDLENAWEDAQAAVRIARDLPSDARRDSTLPALLTRMEEMARKPEMMVRNVSVERECRELLGSEWTGVLDRTRSLLS
ncbi:MAG: hypothetical protein KDA45_17330, partial [Planctomycetales bacterium]|nr:hypothetical protein [Planctomycetales bacterium]